MTERTNKQYPNHFNQKVVLLVTQQGCSAPKTAAQLKITYKLLDN